MNVLALNAGSSSLKYRLFRVSDGVEEALHEGEAERLDGPMFPDAAGKAIEECRHYGVSAVGHRFVHGGADFHEPVVVTDGVRERLRGLAEIDPLHNPTEMAVMEETRRALPDAPVVAVFDTAFHHTLPEAAYRYALPWELSDRLGLRRYGFHGISHRYASERLFTLLGREAHGTKIVTCHLGSGASLCAIRDGESVDTSMGMTPLEGLVMGTRSGDIDPGLLLHLLRTQGMTAEALDDLLNRKSGLLGLSGRSADVRDLEAAAGDARVALALEIFVDRVRKYLGAYAVVLGGLDAIVFTGGVGEHSAPIRARICRGLEFLGVALDESLNQQVGHEPARISAGHSPLDIAGQNHTLAGQGGQVEIWTIPADEERQIAREVAALLQK
ncbi:acetate kinase [Capsulimonas corticalis]|uniref:Acetate kinase n=1 Tax=Capsulimonas corticalis TaxID=2219043 RepID=A0A402D6L1_9BACT|nr:acetate kinase [Capsulimonas corticalis]BDI30590.1 acetate kinase [Capsulimonas corticalis]